MRFGQVFGNLDDQDESDEEKNDMDDDEGEGGGYGDGNYGGDGDVVGDGGKDRNGDGEEDTGDGGSGRDGCEKSEDLWDARLHRIKVVLKNSPDFNVDAESKAVEWRGKLSADTYQFFHGCGNALSLYSFSDDGVQPNSGSSYYSADGASYWTSSKPFAVWWAATRQVPEVAASAFAIGRSEKAAYIRDHTPDDFDAIRCVIAVCNWSREDIKINDYGDWYSLKSAEEEKSVSFSVNVLNYDELTHQVHLQKHTCTRPTIFPTAQGPERPQVRLHRRVYAGEYPSRYGHEGHQQSPHFRP